MARGRCDRPVPLRRGSSPRGSQGLSDQRHHGSADRARPEHHGREQRQTACGSTTALREIPLRREDVARRVRDRVCKPHLRVRRSNAASSRAALARDGSAPPWVVGSNKLTMGVAVRSHRRFLYAANTTSNDIDRSIRSTGTRAQLSATGLESLRQRQRPGSGWPSPPRERSCTRRTATATTSRAYALNTNTGALTPRPSSPTPAGCRSARARSSTPPDEHPVRVERRQRLGSAFSLNSTNGALAPVGSPVSTEAGPISLAAHATGRGAW